MQDTKTDVLKHGISAKNILYYRRGHYNFFLCVDINLSFLWLCTFFFIIIIFTFLNLRFYINKMVSDIFFKFL